MSATSKRRGNAISGQFIARLVEMHQSPAFRVLSLTAHRVLARIEIEHAAHGGKENGKLPCTYDHFNEYGVDRHAIAPAIRELVALGFVEVTRRGCGGNASYRQMSLYRLTYRHVEGAPGDGTHEWREIKSMTEAEAVARWARRAGRRRPARTMTAHPALRQ
jgi:hypothetical protein